MIIYSIKLKNDIYKVAIKGHAGRQEPVATAFNQCCGLVSLLSQSCAAALAYKGKNFNSTVEAGRVEFTVSYDNVSAAVIYALANGLANIRMEFPNELREEA